MNKNTIIAKRTATDFIAETEAEKRTVEVLNVVFDALIAKGCYDPINQLLGYILSEDPTYITSLNNARSLITSVERDDIIRVLLREFLKSKVLEEKNKNERR
jgi:uncharacterized protein (UPF0297 family)